ncbi:MAG TPA: TIGR04211 family SH3 domain-containing protein [Desulfosalsimonadaceae bacterium]|nr:TIGR04211 family SH3 domain-containing protein [Desulfosalsimonadaceae bacterium]
MRLFLGVFFSLMLITAPAGAAAKYVDDLHEITVRLGPGIKYRVIETVSSGTKFETIKTQNGWTQVRLSDSREGWVVTRYLTDDVPDSKKYETLKAKYDPLEKQIKELKAENSRLQADNQTLSQKLTQARDELAQTRTAYEELKEASADVLGLKNKNEKLTQQLKEKNQKIASLEAKISDAFLSEALKWFLIGAGVLLVGIIIGASGKRKRSSLL